MSKRTAVQFALQDICKIALPGAKVLALDGDAEAPSRVPATGQAIVWSGDPGEPEITMSPRTYWFAHRFPIEVTSYQSPGRTAQEAIDDMLSAIGAEIIRDRQLGGLCEWIEAEAPDTQDVKADGTPTLRGATFVIVATYSTSDPLA